MKIEQNQTAGSWEEVFANLPREARMCRHDFGQYVHDRVCDNNFHCADCAIHNNVLRLEVSRQRDGWRPKQPEYMVYGISVPADRLYHRGHTWVKNESDDTYMVGIDDFATRLIGKPDNVELPEIGSQVVMNEPALNMKKQKAEISILSPLTGTVVDTRNPDKGWYLKIKTNTNGESTKHLLKGPEVKVWIMKELERLHTSLSQDDDLGTSFADGGILIDDLPGTIPNADWNRVYREIFLRP
jgi:glycine cleavage system H lipoate-binding protein